MAELRNPTGALAETRAIPEAWQRALQEPAPLAFAWELAQSVDRELRRDFQLLLSLLLAAEAQGSTRLPLQGPELEALHAAFKEEPVDWAAFLADPRLASFVGAPGEGKPLIRLEDAVASQRLSSAEHELATRVAAQAARPAMSVDIAEALLDAPVKLSEEQREAVRAAAAQPLCLISGGPGTGKTSIVAALLRGLLAAGLDPAEIALAAPTGRAAQRLGQALRGSLGAEAAAFEPRTLHRLLGWDGRRFRRGEADPLDARLVLVDEASMVGLELMLQLLRALAPGARLVLLGDAEQLPSVEPGAVFRDLVARGPVQRLEHSFRMRESDPEGRAILAAARALRAGAPAGLAQRDSAAQVAFSGAELLEASGAELERFLRRWWEERIRDAGAELPLAWGAAGTEARLRALAARQEASRLLCLLREGEGLRSAAGVNAFLREEAQRRGPQRPGGFLPGEPVLVARNDYRRGLFNGDQGQVLRIAREDAAPRLEAVFPRGEGFVGFPLDSLGAELEPAYALTVHRAQGAEHEAVALLLPERDHPLLTREILYTALTRARKAALVVGSPALLEAGAARPLVRITGI